MRYAMGKTLRNWLSISYLELKSKMHASESDVLRNTQQRTEQFASAMDISCKENQHQETASFLCVQENITQNSNAFTDCHRNLDDVVQRQQVETLFPEFFATHSRTRLDQNTDLTDMSKYT